MSDKNLFKQLGDQLGRFVSDAETREDMRKSLNGFAQSTFSQFDLLTRDEFDAQLEALDAAQQRISALEVEVSELKEQLERMEQQLS